MTGEISSWLKKRQTVALSSVLGETLGKMSDPLNTCANIAESAHTRVKSETRNVA